MVLNFFSANTNLSLGGGAPNQLGGMRVEEVRIDRSKRVCVCASLGDKTGQGAGLVTLNLTCTI